MSEEVESALGILGRLAGALQAGLLALLHPRVAGEEARLAQGRAKALIEGEERPREAGGDSVGPGGDAPAGDLHLDVEAAASIGRLQRPAHLHLVDRPREQVLERLAVDGDEAGAGGGPDRGPRR